MKVPAAAIASCFLGGIVVGLSANSSYDATSHATWHGSLRMLLLSCFLLAAVLVVAGVALTRLQTAVWAGAACAAFWLVLGVLTAGIAQQPRPADHILSRVGETGRSACAVALARVPA